LYVEPASALTDAQRAAIRANKARLLSELAEEARERTEPIAPAGDASQLLEFKAALRSGRLHVCCNCSAFVFGAAPAGIGRCRRFGVEAWPFVPFWCSGFQASLSPLVSNYLPEPRQSTDVQGQNETG
jgi:hypothetical protein